MAVRAVAGPNRSETAGPYRYGGNRSHHRSGGISNTTVGATIGRPFSIIQTVRYRADMESAPTVYGCTGSPHHSGEISNTTVGTDVLDGPHHKRAKVISPSPGVFYLIRLVPRHLPQRGREISPSASFLFYPSPQVLVSAVSSADG